MRIYLRRIVIITFVCLLKISISNGQTTTVDEDHIISNQFIYILKLKDSYQKESAWTKSTEQLIADHFSYLRGLKEKGVILFAGETDYSLEDKLNFGLVIFHSKKLETATELMENDPAVKAGIMSTELHPFKVVLK